MKLSNLLDFDNIIVQCHDNPDADAIASAYAVYRYIKEHDKNVSLVYSGRHKVQKSNLVLLLDYLGIREVLEYIETPSEDEFDGLVVTVDCQYGAGNVTKILAKHTACIDHHQIEMRDIEFSEIVPELGSCSTLVWKLLKEENYPLDDIKLNTALYYGLYTDTNSLSEIYNPFDKDMRDELPYEKTTVYALKNSNFTLREMEIAGNAMKNYSYYKDTKFAVIKTEQCDPNILGLISDFLLQVEEVAICIVFNEWSNGYKFSVRSCIKEVHANELAAHVSEGTGSGGGHLEKAGGFIQKRLYDEKYKDVLPEEYFNDRVNDYFENCEIIYPKEYDVDVTKLKEYVKKSVHFGYVMAKEIYPIGTPITVRTLEGDFDITVEEDLVILIGIRGEIYPNRLKKFEASYKRLDMMYLDDASIKKPVYIPTVHNRQDGKVTEISKYAKVCQSSGGTHIYACPTTKRVKIFTEWDQEKYMAGKIGDYMAVRMDDLHDIYIIEKDIFAETYDEFK